MGSGPSEWGVVDGRRGGGRGPGRVGEAKARAEDDACSRGAAPPRTQVENVRVDDAKSSVEILFTPTIPHCSMATLIGLCIRVKLLRSLPSRFKTSVRITPGTHQSEHAVNKQLNDKERVAAAMENDHLLQLVNKCLANSDPVDPDEDLEGVRELEDEESARAPLALRAVEEGLLRSVW